MDPAQAAVALVVAYVATPVGKEAWVAAAPIVLGVPALAAAALLLSFEACVCLGVLHLLPIDRVLARFPRLARSRDRLKERILASRLARHGLPVALGGLLALPFHSGGGIAGSATGRAIGLTRPAVFAAVVGAVALRFIVVLSAYYGASALLG